MLLPWAKKAGAGFSRAVLNMGKMFGWPSDYSPWMMGCIAFESNETFSPSVKNMAGSGATGLIQFMPKTAEGLGTTIEDLEDMTQVGQLYYVQKYFAPYSGKIISLADMYMAILMPHYIGADGDSVLFSGGVSFRQNAGLDNNKDGKVTVDEAVDNVRKKLARGYLPEFMADV